MDRFVYLIYRTFGAVLRALPLPVVFRLGQMVGWFGYYIAGPYRRLVLRNLEIAFGDELSPRERRNLAHKHFGRLVANLFSSLRVAGLSREQLRAIMEPQGTEKIDQVVAQGRGIVVFIGHYGNWELITQSIPLLYGHLPLGTVYQRLGNPFIEAEVRASRGRLGVQLFERKEGFAGALKTLRAGGLVGVLVDQHAGDAGHWCPFFDRLASTSSLAATLALRTGSMLASLSACTIAPGRWSLVFSEPMDPSGRSVDDVTAELNRVLERQIRRQPEDWFWVHNRWKTPTPKFLLASYKRGLGGADHSDLKPFRIVIRSSNWLGDVVMTVPAVRAIKRGRPDAHVTILAPAKLVDIWKQVPEVDEVISIERGDGVFSVARKLRAGRFEAAILFPNSLRVALEVWLAGIPRRVGYPGHRRAWLLNQVFREKKVKKPRPPEHQVHHYLRLAKFVGADIEAETKALNGKPAAASITRKVRERPRIALCPGAEYGPAKRWLPERFAEVIRRTNEAGPADWVIVGVQKDAPVADEIAALAPGACQNLVGKTSLAQLIEELRNCDALLTNDTGTMHLASLLNVPTVAIFGSTEPALTGPLGAGHQIVRRHVECSPCFLRECPIDFRCMREVSVDDAVAALEQVLARNRTDCAASVS